MIRQGTKQKTLIFLIGLLFSLNVFGQNLIESRQTSYYTYIYKISNEEAQSVYKKDLWEVDSSFFHTLVDSFPTNKTLEKKLDQGHYLKTFSSKDKQDISITSIQDFEVFIFNNNTDLCIQVYDLNGELIEGAEVSVRWKNLKFDSKSKSYLDRKSNQRGLLKVHYNGFTAYYNLSRSYNNSFIKRGTRKMFYGTPLKYVWVPVNYVIRLPIDAMRSIQNGWAQGSISKTQQFFIRSYNKVACKFDDFYCENDYQFTSEHTGYMVFNKPKYQPGDTVKFKAFIVTKKGRPVNKKVQASIYHKGKNVVLGELTPYRKGGYVFQFYLHDSLQLKLDRNYTISLGINKYRKYTSASFKYEDYELKKNQLDLKVDNENQYRNKDVILSISAKDENDLNVMDGRVEVLVTPSSIYEYYDDQVFVPDTLLFLKQNIDVSGETKIIIPDSILPKVNLHYNISAKLLSSDNEELIAKDGVNFFYERKVIDVQFKSDSVHFEYLKNGEVENKNVLIYSRDNFGNEKEVYNGKSPCAIKLNPYFSEYYVKADSAAQLIDITRESALLQCFSERTKDSVFIQIDNPRGIPFSYNIYRKNKQTAYGYTDSLNVKEKTHSKQNYFVSLQYLWGGEVMEDTYRIPLIDKKLNVQVTEPAIVYPGQKTKIQIKVTDVSGDPVEDVDLTAYSLTKKFNYSAPQLPYLGKERASKNIINNFKFDEFYLGYYSGLKLDYDAWKTLAGIDTIAYYNFIYPQDSIYSYEYKPKDSVTQFAPFVVEDGEIEPIHVIYVDGKPVYFSWSTNERPYSFPIREGYHQIKIRTTFKEITIDSIRFNHGKKLIFSLDQKLSYPHVKVEDAQAILSLEEQRILYKYIVPYRYNSNNNFVYLEGKDNVHILTPESRHYGNNLAGPMAGDLNFQLPDRYTTHFFHEPFFEYDFAEGLLKMRSKEKRLYPLNLYKHTKPNISFEELVYTKESINAQWKAFIEKSRYRKKAYVNPNETSEGQGRLSYSFKKVDKQLELPLNVLLFKNDDHEFLRIYPGNTSLMHALEKGSYKLIFFYSGAKYHVKDSILIHVNGLNYYEFDQLDIKEKDSFSIGVIDIIEESYLVQDGYILEDDKLEISNQYRREFTYSAVGELIEGYIYDIDDVPLIGASVIVKGTTYGAITDIDGHYSIVVPPNKSTLIVSYTGYETQEIKLGLNQVVNVVMDEGNVLDEVVVVGYGIQKNKRSLGYAISKTKGLQTVTAEAISRSVYVDGIRVSSLASKASGVSFDQTSSVSVVSIKIKGSNSLEFDKSPLYIINGNVFDGDISELDESLIKNMQVLKDAQATAIYGEKGASGVVIIETEEGAFNTRKSNLIGGEYDATFFEAASQASGIRNNFSDYAFWQPKLSTNKDGIVEFEVEFPDDVTSWNTFYLAMNGKRQSGQTAGRIKSYKPLIAQLALPKFLVEGDTTNVIGKVMNYSPKKMEVKRKLEYAGSEIFDSTESCENVLIDTISIVAESDSLDVKYYLETQDGYLDGEERNIPVFPLGMEKTLGGFYVLDKDTSIQIQFDETYGDVSLYARADVLDVINDELQHIVNYRYLCNEQLASKLKAHLTQKMIADYSGENVKNDRSIKKIIKLLTKNQKRNGLWGWWNNSSDSHWISLHVLEALMQAKSKGYRVSLGEDKIVETLVWQLENSSDFYTKIRILKIINLLGSTINVEKYIKELEKQDVNSLNKHLNLIDLKQDFGLEYSLDPLDVYKDSTLFGNVYYSINNSNLYLLNNDIHNTLMAYKILKNDTEIDTEELLKMRNFFLENRKSGYWRNTFESMKIIETILPDLLVGKEKLQPSSLILEGAVDSTITVFPFEMNAEASQDIMVNKTGDFPIYFTSYQRYWEKSPEKKIGDFEISTSFDGETESVLKGGERTTLVAKVKVKKDAEYVMINIPIPAGCSYTEKKNNLKNETHREYFKNETSIFIDYLKEGEYTFEIELIPRYSGTYTINPAKIELMYYPTFYANNEMDKVLIDN